MEPTSCGLSSFRNYMVAGVVGVVLAQSPDVSAQGCVLDKNRIDVSQTDYWVMQASTTQNNCGSREVKVDAWISGHSPEPDRNSAGFQVYCLEGRNQRSGQRWNCGLWFRNRGVRSHGLGSVRVGATESSDKLIRVLL